jgi:hypothetical protein
MYETKKKAAFDTLDSVIMTAHTGFSHLPRTGSRLPD